MAASIDGITGLTYDEFNSDLNLSLQQQPSKLEMTVMQGSHGGDQATPIQHVEPFELGEKTTKLVEHEIEEYEITKRWCIPTDYRKALGMDWSDMIRAMQDPTGQLILNLRAARNRKVDNVIIDALVGNSYRGNKGPTETVALPASQKIAAGGTGLTFSKMRDALEKMLVNNLDPAYDNMTMAIGPGHVKGLLGQVTEYDGEELQALRSLQNGSIARLYGFNLIVCNQLGSTSAAPAIAYDSKAVHLGTWKPFGVRVDEIATKDMMQQVYACASYGAVRTEEKRVVEISNV